MVGRPRKQPEAAETSAPVKEKKYPVRLLKNYRPAEDFEIEEWIDPDDHEQGKHRREPEGAELKKVWAGTTVFLGRADAERCIKMRIGERADEFIAV